MIEKDLKQGSENNTHDNVKIIIGLLVSVNCYFSWYTPKFLGKWPDDNVYYFVLFCVCK